MNNINNLVKEDYKQSITNTNQNKGNTCNALIDIGVIFIFTHF